MTGNGMNDAPALIYMSMGLTIGFNVIDIVKVISDRT